MEIFSAPIQGYTCSVYRALHSACFDGVSQYYTPFFRLENNTLRNKDFNEIALCKQFPLKSSSLTVAQIIGSEPQEIQSLIEILKTDFNRIDLNFGCPYPMQTSKKHGAGILAYPEKVEEILEVIARYPQLEFSVKMRAGFHSYEDCLNLVPLLNAAKLSHITFHPRLADDVYSGVVNTDIFEKFLAQSSHPLVYNGDIFDIQSLRQIAEQQYPNLKAIMLGLGLLQNPMLAEMFISCKEISEEEKLTRLNKFHALLSETFLSLYSDDEKKVLKRMKTVWDYFMTDYDNKFKKKFLKASALGQYLALTAAFFNDFK